MLSFDPSDNRLNISDDNFVDLSPLDNGIPNLVEEDNTSLEVIDAAPSVSFTLNGTNYLKLDNPNNGPRLNFLNNDGNILMTDRGFPTGNDNIIIGDDNSGGSIISGNQNILIGRDVGGAITNASANIMIGRRS
ncbi:MAG: hypothetical protein AAF847_10120 [Bacteroidota bacterium]